ncbi:MAG: DMT family transporter [Proteobacteria bacterium]|nr:DMT family transporter [Pseudomonadota bacterium]
MNRQQTGVLEMTGAMTLVGTIGWFVVVSGQPALSVVFWRCAFGALTMLVICTALGLWRGTLTWKKTAIAALGGVAIVLNWVLLFAAYSRASISIATVVYNMQPFMLLGFGVLLFAEKFTLKKLAWLAVAFTGMVLIVQAKPDAGYAGSDYFTGVLMALAAAFLWAVAVVITKKLAGTPPHLIVFIQVCVGIVLLAPFAGFDQLPRDAGAWSALVALGVIHTGVVYILMYGAVQKLPTHLQGALSFIYPVVAILVDIIAFDYRMQLVQFVGAFTILFAVAGMNFGWPPSRKARAVGGAPVPATIEQDGRNRKQA